MKKCLVIGGGFAGLSAAVYLSEKKIQVDLIEASPKLGGRAYSLYNKNFYDNFDNGQHILMGCYHSSLDFLKKIGALEELEFQQSLQVNFVNSSSVVHQLKTPKHFYPFNLLWGILNYKALSVKERLKIVDFFLDLACCFEEDIKEKNVLEWLKEKGQSENSIKSFWEILVIGALNTSLERASACMFASILKRIFLDGSKSASIVIPKNGLSELFVNQSEAFIKNNMGRIFTSERVLDFIIENEKIEKVITDKNEYSNYDFVITSVPIHALSKIKFTGLKDSTNFTQLFYELQEIEYSPILNVHLWLKVNPFDQKFYGLIDSKIHWLFNHGKHISLTTSNAGDYINLKNEIILSDFYSELEKYFPIFKRDLVVDSKVIKEKRATFIPDTQSNILREKVFSPLKNLFFAGDWVNTGLPSTIESAVQSGRMAAEKIFY